MTATKFWQKTSGGDIAAFVRANTGMSLSDLLYDEKEYRVDGLAEAARFIRGNTGSEIHIIGDYDADGIMASAIRELTFRELGIKSVVHIPKRFTEGYGVNPAIIGSAAASPAKHKICVTVDNGIAAIDAECRNHGSDSRSAGNRMHGNRKRAETARQKMRGYLEEEGKL